MKNAWIVELKSEAELYLENLSQFEAEYYGEAFQTKKQELEGQVKIFSEELEKIANTTGKELADVQFLKEQREKEKKQLKEQIDHFKKHIEEYEHDYKERERKRKASITRLKNLIEKKHGEIKKNQEKINPLLFWKKYEDEKNAIASREEQIKDCEAELAAISTEPENNDSPALKEKLSVLKENLSTLENELKKMERKETTIKKDLDSKSEDLFRNFLDTAQVISYRDAVDSVLKKNEKIFLLKLLLETPNPPPIPYQSNLYLLICLLGLPVRSAPLIKLVSFKDSPSIPCELCAEQLALKMFKLVYSLPLESQRAAAKINGPDFDYPFLKVEDSLDELKKSFAGSLNLSESGKDDLCNCFAQTDNLSVDLKKETVLEILDLIETLSDDGDLPELFERFAGEVLSEDSEVKELFEEFKRLYRETPEQILVTEQRYFMERQLEEQREANEKLLEEQREANEKLLAEQREKNRILEEAERQRSREEARRSEEDREHNRRMEALSKEANRQKEEYYRRQQERQREEERERDRAQAIARRQCLNCANRIHCLNSYKGVINCAAYVAKR